jgi:hypothetical protein
VCLTAAVTQYTKRLHESRHAGVFQVGQALLQHFDGQAANLVAAAQHSAVRLVQLVTQHMPGFRDHAVYGGRQVSTLQRAVRFTAAPHAPGGLHCPGMLHQGTSKAALGESVRIPARLPTSLCSKLATQPLLPPHPHPPASAPTQVFLYKRAQIFVGDVYGAFRGQGLGRFDDVSSLTMFADYRVPVVLRVMGVLDYSPELEAQVGRVCVGCGPHTCKPYASPLCVHWLSQSLTCNAPAMQAAPSLQIPLHKPSVLAVTTHQYITHA